MPIRSCAGGPTKSPSFCVKRAVELEDAWGRAGIDAAAVWLGLMAILSFGLVGAVLWDWLEPDGLRQDGHEGKYGADAMNFQQLRIVRETVRRNFNLTEVANTLFTSQSGVSKHIKDLEDELGVELFVRRGKRLTGLTDPGKDVINVVERILIDTTNIKRLSEQFSSRDEGQLVIATTHTQARYALPHVVASAFPKVRLTLHQGSPTEISAMLSDGDADIGICTEALRDVPALITFPFYSWHHGVVVPRGHALETVQPPSAKCLAWTSTQPPS